MISSAINIITDHLNSFIKNEFDINEDVVVLSNLLEQDGSVAPNLENKIVVFLINVEKDTMPSQHQAYSAGQRLDRADVGFVPVFVNLYLIFACNFSGKNYGESLKFLNHTISFFQRHPVWDRNNTPDFNLSIDRLCFDIVNLDIKDLSNLWGVISSKYIPSVIYKIRTFKFESEALKDRVFTVRDPRQNVEP